jgi:hypothetical protein
MYYIEKIMYVIIQSYNETNQERQRELAFCLRYLLKNPHIKEVIDLSELAKHPPMYEEAIQTHPEKYRFVGNTTWLTYNTAIRYARDNLPIDEVVALINNDIFFGKNKDWSQLQSLLSKMESAHKLPVMLTLTRHEWGSSEAVSTLDPSFVQTMGSNSQDAWIWINGSVDPSEHYEIPIGIMGCDNAFAHRLFHYNSVIPYNVGDQWKVFHYDKCRYKTGSNSKQWHATNKK